MSFFNVRRKLAICEKPGKNLGKTMVFMHWKLLPRISVQACNNAEKWTPGAPKTTPRPLETLQHPARRLRNRRRSASRRSKTGQVRQQTQQETQNALKKHPRSKNGANMAPRDLRKLRMSGPPSRRTPPERIAVSPRFDRTAETRTVLCPA